MARVLSVSCLLLALCLPLACSEPNDGPEQSATAVETPAETPAETAEPEDPCPPADRNLTTLTTIAFDLYGPTVAPESEPAIDDLARRLLRCPDLNIEVQVHTSTRGMGSFNARQSQAIADLIRARLLEGGVANERLAACGYGESRPDTSTGREAWDDIQKRVNFVPLAGSADAFECPSIEE